MPLIHFWASHTDELFRLTLQHVMLVAVSTGIAVTIGVPLGVIAAKHPRFGAPVVGFANLVQTIPSLALFGFLIPLPFIGGIGPRAALIALVLYGLLPVLRTTVAGLRGIDPAIHEAAVAMGMRPWQMLRMVELPLAWPSMLAGIRVTTVVGVGTATIAAAIGAGGLGEYIFRGLSMVDATVILAGAVPSAAMALTADALLGMLERRAAPPSALDVAWSCGGDGDTRRGRGRDRASRVLDVSRGGGRVEELHRAVRAGRVGRPDTRTVRWSHGRSPSESRRHVHLRSGAPHRRHRRLRRVHRHGVDGGLQAARWPRPCAGARRGPPAVRGERPDDAGAARIQQYVCDPGARERCQRAEAAHDHRRLCQSPAAGMRASATSSSSGRMDSPGSRGPTGCSSRSHPRCWICRSPTGPWRSGKWISLLETPRRG